MDFANIFVAVPHAACFNIHGHAILTVSPVVCVIESGDDRVRLFVIVGVVIFANTLLYNCDLLKSNIFTPPPLVLNIEDIYI